MTPATPVQPRLDDLLTRYLQRQAEAEEAGLTAFDPGEVTPYEAGPVQPIDARMAWDEAQLALGKKVALKAPPGWSQLVAGHEPVVALALCAGNFPQLVRNFHMILQKANLAELRPMAGRPTPAPALEVWIGQVEGSDKPEQFILALGALRLAKQFERADRFVQDNDANIPEEKRAAWENEKAALAWHRGDVHAAYAMWQDQEASLPVLFNRGMADLFLGNIASAQANLSQVVEQLPESSAWHHLAQLYLTLAQSR